MCCQTCNRRCRISQSLAHARRAHLQIGERRAPRRHTSTSPITVLPKHDTPLKTLKKKPAIRPSRTRGGTSCTSWCTAASQSPCTKGIEQKPAIPVPLNRGQPPLCIGRPLPPLCRGLLQLRNALEELVYLRLPITVLPHLHHETLKKSTPLIQGKKHAILEKNHATPHHSSGDSRHFVSAGHCRLSAAGFWSSATHSRSSSISAFRSQCSRIYITRH